MSTQNALFKIKTAIYLKNYSLYEIIFVNGENDIFNFFVFT